MSIMLVCATFKCKSEGDARDPARVFVPREDRHVAVNTLKCLVPASRAKNARTVYAVYEKGLESLRQVLGDAATAFARDSGFEGRAGEVLLLPGASGIGSAVLGLGREHKGRRDPLPFGALAAKLPRGNWKVSAPGSVDFDDVVLGYCLGAYTYVVEGTQRALPVQARLVVPARTGALGVAIAQSVWLGRDLINMPANLLGPVELAKAARAALEPHGAEVAIVKGAALAEAYPMLAHVGMGSERPSRVVIAEWRGTGAADDAPLISLVGKGVCFDTGGYDLKPAAGMLRMKKDMGGAALMLGLAMLIMARDVPVRLELRLGCVENSVSGRAMRPSDVVRTRSGRTVEIGNTDAEGRLVLCDLLTEASEAAPDLMFDAATLTGAARVALGPDLPALFCNDDALAETILRRGESWSDPLWRLPLHQGYADWLRSPVADIGNVSLKPQAGAITAALFLEVFVTAGTRWAHIDTYAWNDNSRFGRPEGGETPSLRAVFDTILHFFNLTEGSGSGGTISGMN